MKRLASAVLAAALLAQLGIPACSVKNAASDVICQPAQRVRCNDCQRPAGDTRPWRGWITCSADGTSFLGTCDECAPEDPTTVEDAGGVLGFGLSDAGFTPISPDDGGSDTDDSGQTHAAPVEGGATVDGSTGSSPPSCVALADGPYCGDVVNGDPRDVYRCLAGEVDGLPTVCTNGCGASDGEDGCLPSCVGLDDGTYCGDDRVGASAGVLYQCSAGTVYGQPIVCAAGCGATTSSDGPDTCL